MEKVSILIPCYNAESWIAQAIESALAQTWDNIEVIAYDDGSNDSSPEIIKSFQSKITFELGPNLGANQARNHLLKQATGDWVQFLDADDWLNPKKIAEQLAVADQYTDAIYGPVNLEYWVGGRFSHSKKAIPNSQEDIYSHWLSWQLAQTGVVIWRRNKILEIGGWNNIIECCHDNEITLRALQYGLNFKYADFLGINYRLWSGLSVGRRDIRTLIKEKSALIDEMISWLKQNNRCKKLHMNIAGKAYFDMAKKISEYDTSAAIEYANRYKKKKCFISNNTSPRFRLVYMIAGFRVAIALAEFIRSIRRK